MDQEPAPTPVQPPPAVVELPAAKVPDILEAVPVKLHKELELLLQQNISAKSHRGPLPTPDDLERYCALIPNGGERIMVRHEKQSDHRMEIEKIALNSQLAQSKAGQWMGFVLGALGLTLYHFPRLTQQYAFGCAQVNVDFYCWVNSAKWY